MTLVGIVSDAVIPWPKGLANVTRACILAVVATVAISSNADRFGVPALWVPAGAPDQPGTIRIPEESTGVGLRLEAPLLDIRLPPISPAEMSRPPDWRQIGVGRPVPERYRGDIVDELVWLTTQAGDLVTTFRITSPEAKAIRASLRGVLPHGAVLRFYATGERDGRDVRGTGRPFTQADFARPRKTADADSRTMGVPHPDMSADFAHRRPVWSPIVDGEAIDVAVVLTHGTLIDALSLELTGLSHFHALPADFPSSAARSGACEAVDAMCPPAPQCQLNAALRLTFTDVRGNSYSCSATAVNDGRSLEDKLAAPSVLTSHGCLSDAYEAETAIVTWHQRSTACDSGTRTNRNRELGGGADLLASHPESNHTLLRLRDPVPADTDHCLAGWSVAEDILGKAAFTVHDGRSGLKEWAEGSITGRTEFTLDNGEVATGYELEVAEGALWDGSAGAGWFVKREGETSYVGVQSGVSGDNCGVASAGSFVEFFDAVGEDHLGAAREDDHGDAAEDATVVDVGTSGSIHSEGAIDPKGDVDVFRFDVASAGTVTVYTRSDIDTVGRLLTESGEQIGYDDDGGANSNFRIIADVTAGSYFVRIHAFENATGDYTLVVSFAEQEVPRALTYSIPLFLAEGESTREGFLRVVNHSDEEGKVDVTAIDDGGTTYGPVSLALGNRQTVHLNSRDLERGNAAKGVPVGVGDGRGNWRLQLESNLDLTPLAYVRTQDGFVTSMHDVVGHAGRLHRVAFFNPASNENQRSVLRLINPTPSLVSVTIRGRDDAGQAAPGGPVRLQLDGFSSTSITSRDLEEGTSGVTAGRLGDGAGKWELAVEGSGDILAMSLLETPTGHLTNLSTVNVRDEAPLFLEAGGERQGFLRIVNNSVRSGTVSITGTDADGIERGSVSFALGPQMAKHFNSADLERGNEDKGLKGRLADGRGSWHLRLSSELDITTQVYVRTADGFVTSMHEQIPLKGLTHDVAFFNPGSNRDQRSWLQLANIEAREVAVAIEAWDDAGRPGLRPVTLSIEPGATRVISAHALEAGDPSFDGRLGDGRGKWQLALSANGRIGVVNVLETPTGHLANLSTVAAETV